jgi:hypothetical protein
VDGTVLEESSQLVRETLLEEADALRAKEELSLRLLERVLLEVVDSETHLVTRDTYRYHGSEQYKLRIGGLSVTCVKYYCHKC